MGGYADDEEDDEDEDAAGGYVGLAGGYAGLPGALSARTVFTVFSAVTPTTAPPSATATLPAPSVPSCAAAPWPPRTAVDRPCGCTGVPTANAAAASSVAAGAAPRSAIMSSRPCSVRMGMPFSTAVWCFRPSPAARPSSSTGPATRYCVLPDTAVSTLPPWGRGCVGGR